MKRTPFEQKSNERGGATNYELLVFFVQKFNSLTRIYISVITKNNKIIIAKIEEKKRLINPMIFKL